MTTTTKLEQDFSGAAECGRTEPDHSRLRDVLEGIRGLRDRIAEVERDSSIGIAALHRDQQVNKRPLLRRLRVADNDWPA